MPKSSNTYEVFSDKDGHNMQPKTSMPMSDGSKQGGGKKNLINFEILFDKPIFFNALVRVLWSLLTDAKRPTP